MEESYPRQSCLSTTDALEQRVTESLESVTVARRLPCMIYASQTGTPFAMHEPCQRRETMHKPCQRRRTARAWCATRSAAEQGGGMAGTRQTRPHREGGDRIRIGTPQTGYDSKILTNQDPISIFTRLDPTPVYINTPRQSFGTMPNSGIYFAQWTKTSWSLT